MDYIHSNGIGRLYLSYFSDRTSIGRDIKRFDIGFVRIVIESVGVAVYFDQTTSSSVRNIVLKFFRLRDGLSISGYFNSGDETIIATSSICLLYTSPSPRD